MRWKDKKLAVFEQMEREPRPVSLKELLTRLGSAYKERSIRRYLVEMLHEGLIERIGKRRATLYQIRSQRWVMREERTHSCFSQKSLPAITHVRKPLYARSPVAYREEWLEAYTQYIPDSIRSHLHAEGKRSKHAEPAGTYAHQIFRRLLIDLSYNSSRLEGNTYSLLDTQRLLLEGKGVEGKLDEEKVMILNHKEAIRYLVDQAPRLHISHETICTLHYLLADGLVESRYAGKIRDYGVRIGGSTYIPYEDSRRLDFLLQKILKKASQIHDPFEQSFFLLVHLSYLQPFADVNKRTARLSANIPLVKQNLVPLSFNDVGREDYISATLAIYELQDVQPLLDLYVFSYLRTCTQYDSTAEALGFDAVRVRYRAERRELLHAILTRRLSISNINAQAIPEKDRKAFLEDIYEDLEHMDSSRIAGLGITLQELKEWESQNAKIP